MLDPHIPMEYIHAEVAKRTTNMLEAGEVRRFHATPMVETQTVGHHSFGVAVILTSFGCLLNAEDLPLIGEALMHDLAELWTGDVPFTTKRGNKEVKQALDSLELKVRMDHLFVSPRLTPRQHLLLKLADMLEGLRWCNSGHERGAKIVANRWVQAIEELLYEKHQLLSPQEVDRVWAIFVQIHDMGDNDNHYSSFNSFKRIREKQRQFQPA